MKAIKNTLVGLFAAFLFSISAIAQPNKKQIKVGKNLPELTITGIINRNASEINLSDLYKDAPLIIDFWFTSCVPCIKEMKFLDSLKANHPGKFNVLMVTYQSEKEIQAFLKSRNNRDVKTSNLFLATSDTLLHKLFPHVVAPHNIWIDQKGTVRSITGSEEINERNILNFAAAQNVVKMQQKGELLDFDPMKEFHLMDSNFVYRSMISPAIPTGTSGSLAGTSKGLAYNRFFQYNTPIAHLFWSAFSVYSKSPLGNYKPDLIEVHTSDSLRLFYPIGKFATLLKNSPYKDMAEWAKDNTYCYALTLPDRVPDTLFRDYLFSDLQRYFKVVPKIETRDKWCMVVTKKDGAALKISTEMNNPYPKIQFQGGKMEIRNAKIREVLNYLVTLYDDRQLIEPFAYEIPEESDKRFDLDLDFKGTKALEDGLGPKDYYQRLGKYGFHFERKIRPYPILILYDLKNQ